MTPLDPGGPDIAHGLRSLVPVMTSSGELIDSLREQRVLLEATILRVANWKLIRTVAIEADVLVVDTAAAPTQDIELLKFSTSHPHCSIVVAHRQGRRGPEHLQNSHLPNRVIVVSWDSRDISELALEIAWARFMAWATRIRDEVLRTRHLPYVARLALRETIRPEVGSRPSLTQIAHEVGVNRSHLSRVCHRSNVPLSEITDAWSVVQSVALRWYSNLPWDTVAWRCGYASLSGLSDLLYRSTGGRIRQVATQEPEAWFLWFERDILAPLLKPPEAA